MQPRPLAPYAVSKVAAEYYVHTLGSLYGMETVVLRIFNAYGPGQFIPAAHAPVIPLFMWQAVRGASLVIFGDGEQTRDFVYIDDVVDALVAAATAKDVNRSTINVGSGQEVSINRLVDLIAQTVRRPVNTLYNHEESGGVPRMVADLTLARAKLGFAPRVTLEEGLKRLLELDPRFSLR
jgi:UDP-glucose 4-epimerase